MPHLRTTIMVHGGWGQHFDNKVRRTIDAFAVNLRAVADNHTIGDIDVVFIEMNFCAIRKCLASLPLKIISEDSIDIGRYQCVVNAWSWRHEICLALNPLRDRRVDVREIVHGNHSLLFLPLYHKPRGLIHKVMHRNCPEVLFLRPFSASSSIAESLRNATMVTVRTVIRTVPHEWR